ncbi:MAG: hypothetical protein ABIK89_18130 [Planctomycetota bacterium]
MARSLSRPHRAGEIRGALCQWRPAGPSLHARWGLSDPIGRWLAGSIAMCWMLCASGQSGEFERVLEETSERFVVENPGPAVAPVIYLVGQPDRSQEPARKTKGLSLNGTRLSETLLSESVMILYPDGSGKWGYHTGFDIFREPQLDQGKRIDPRTLVEYDKWRYDPLEPVRCGGSDMNLLLLHATGPMPPALYEIAFPEPIRIRSLEVRSNCDQVRTPGVVVKARLFADRGRETLIAERLVGAEQPAKTFPVRFEDLDRSRGRENGTSLIIRCLVCKNQ